MTEIMTGFCMGEYGEFDAESILLQLLVKDVEVTLIDRVNGNECDFREKEHSYSRWIEYK